MPQTLGLPASTYIEAYEEDKISCEHAAAVPVYKGQLVVLNPNGTISPWANTLIASAAIVNGGSGYAVGDIIQINGTNIGAAYYQVTTVSAGVVTGITPLTIGAGYTAATGVATSYAPNYSGSGSGLTITTTTGASSYLVYGIALKSISAYNITQGGTGQLGPLVTIVTRGFALVYGQTSNSNTTLAAGPVTCSGMNVISAPPIPNQVQAYLSDQGQAYAIYTASTGTTDHVGWALDQTTGASITIRVLVKD